MKIKFLLALSLVFLFTVPVLAQNNAKKILDRLYCPSGQMPVQDVVIELEEMSSEGSTGKMALSSKDKIYFKKNCRIRIDIIISDPGGQLDGRQMTIIRDGTHAFHYLSTGQYPVKKKLDIPSPPLNMLFGVMQYPQDAANTYSIVGTEVIDGVKAAKISIKNGKSEQFVWVDPKRLVPLKLEVDSKKGKDAVKKTVVYKDIGMTKDGRYIPMKLEKYTNGTMTELIVYKALVINSDINDDLFTPMEKFLK